MKSISQEKHIQQSAFAQPRLPNLVTKMSTVEGGILLEKIAVTCNFFYRPIWKALEKIKLSVLTKENLMILLKQKVVEYL